MKDEEKAPAPADPTAAIEAKRALRKAGVEADRKAQYAIDLAALDEAEVQYGDDSVAALPVRGFVRGQPTMMIVRSPGGTPFYNRYKSMVRAAGKNVQAIGAAQEMLGGACIVYPAEAAQEAFFAAFPGATISAGICAMKFVELSEEDEKKG